MKSYITSIGIANPPHKIPQMSIADFMAESVVQGKEERQRLMALYKASGISFRYSYIPDYGKKNGEFEFFPNTPGLEPFPTLLARMQLYEKHALGLSYQAIMDCLKKVKINKKEITHLITVSCTGMYAPGLDLEIVETLGLNHNIQRTCINYMGCYAAFNAFKAADAFCKTDADAKVLIVCIELCTLHFQKNNNWDDILSNAIFGDGAAAIIIESQKPEGPAFSVESFYCDIAYEGKKDMAWKISNFGFEMTLSSYIPALIRGGIKNLTSNLLRYGNLDQSEIDFYGIHPGGKGILEAIEKELNLDKSHTQYSYEILRNYGNMSSAAVVFVLHKILYSLNNSDDNKNVVSFAFGPGLTLESMILKTSVNSFHPEYSLSQNQDHASIVD